MHGYVRRLEVVAKVLHGGVASDNYIVGVTAMADGIAQLITEVAAMVLTDEDQFAAFVLGQLAAEPGIEQQMVELGMIQETEAADDKVILGQAKLAASQDLVGRRRWCPE
ncbi:hypothetical protein D3C77_460840 [compost metagenome]